MTLKKLFIEGNDPDSRAYFGWQNHDLALLGIREGYFDSANELVDIALIQGQKGCVNILDQFIFPIMFSYRHSLEICIKHIYFRVKSSIPSGGHTLLNLWDNLYRDILNSNNYSQIKSSMSNYNLTEIRDIIKEFNAIDLKSDVFRYLIDKNAALYFTQWKYIDYSNLKGTMNYLYSNLNAIYYTIDEIFSS